MTALALLGCSTLLGVRTFGVAFPAEGDLRELPVVLTDHTLSVTGVALLFEELAPADDGAMAVPGVPNALAIGWTGGVCDRSVAIDVRQGEELTFTIETTRDAGGCLLAGIGRRLIVQLNRPVAPADVEVIQE